MEEENGKRRPGRPSPSDEVLIPIEQLELMFQEWMDGTNLRSIALKCGFNDYRKIYEIRDREGWEQRKKDIYLAIRDRNDALMIKTKQKIVDAAMKQVDIALRKINKLMDSDLDGTVKDENGVPILTESYIKSPKDFAIIVETFRILRGDDELEKMQSNTETNKKLLSEDQKKKIWQILNKDDAVEAEYVEVDGKIKDK